MGLSNYNFTNLVISQSVTIVTVDGTDTLVVDLPARTYGDNCKICIVIAQTIPNLMLSSIFADMREADSLPYNHF